MQATLSLYAKFLVLFVLLALVVGFNLGFWGLRRDPEEPARWSVPVANPERGRMMIRAYGCGTCHTVPGVREATGKVGPRLDRVKGQVYLAGVLPNSPQNLVFWIQHPQETAPRTAMPDLGVGAEDARDIAAYLYGLP